jgi:CheY-like chemotaxis protein
MLIVDDNRDLIESLSALFELQGFAVAVATSGTAALACFTSDPADVVLIDLGMPQMNGFELVKGLKELSTTPLLLIAMTGWTRPGDVQAAEAAGFDHYVTKPLDTEPLESIIRLWITHTRRSAPQSNVGSPNHLDVFLRTRRENPDSRKSRCP